MLILIYIGDNDVWDIADIQPMSVVIVEDLLMMNQFSWLAIINELLVILNLDWWYSVY